MSTAGETIALAPSRGQRADLWALAPGVAGALSAAALWLGTRPYEGIVHDARIYIGRGLANAAPETVGRDLMFVHDGQSAFSAYPLLVDVLLSALGASGAALLLTAAGLVIWLGAAVAFASRLGRGPRLWLMLVCAAVLPGAYGGHDVLRYGEALATPRSLAEALVLGALALLAGGRRCAAAAALLLAALFHPVMALCGIGVLGLVLAFDDRRWLWAAAAGAAGVLAAAALGLPVADRLFIPVDAEWRAVMDARNTYLFPTAWRPENWARTAVQLTTVLVAATLLPQQPRRIFWSAAAVGAAGLGATLALGDWWATLLVTQVQPWRALWLVSLLAAVGVAFSAPELWRRDGLFRVSLALLALAWAGIDQPATALPVCALLLAVHALALKGRTFQLASAVALVAATVAVATFTLTAVGAMTTWRTLLQGMPREADALLQTALRMEAHGWPLAVLAAVLAVAAPRLGSRGLATAALAGAAALCLAVGWLWDDRGAARRSFESGEGAAALTAMIESRPGAVLWIGGNVQSWLLAGRPQWGTSLQGAGMVFSRPLAIAWDDRMRRLIALGLAPPSERDAFQPKVSRLPPSPTAGAVARLCEATEAPAWIVAPAESVDAGLRWRAVGMWRSPEPVRLLITGGARFAWTRTEAYAVIPCAAASRP